MRSRSYLRPSATIGSSTRSSHFINICLTDEYCGLFQDWQITLVGPEVSAQSKHLFLGNSFFVLILVLFFVVLSKDNIKLPHQNEDQYLLQTQGLNKCACAMFCFGHWFSSQYCSALGYQDISVFVDRHHTPGNSGDTASHILLSRLKPGFCSWLVTLDEFLILLYLSFYKVRTTVLISGCFQAQCPSEQCWEPSKSMVNVVYLYLHHCNTQSFSSGPNCPWKKINLFLLKWSHPLGQPYLARDTSTEI